MSIIRIQLAEATASLEAKNTTVSDLGKRVEELQESLVTKSQELESKVATQAEHERAREAAELELEETRNSLRVSQEELQQVTASLQFVQDEVRFCEDRLFATDEYDSLKLQNQALPPRSKLFRSLKLVSWNLKLH